MQLPTPPSLLPVLAFGAAATVTLVRIAELRLRARVNAVVVRGGSDTRALLEKLVGISILGATMFVVAYAFDPSLSRALGSIPALDQPFVGWCGAVLTLLGTIVIAIAQFSMGNSWRIGVPEKECNRLVTEGIYRWSRNPIYVGMAGALGGVFLMAPNAVSLALFTTAWVSIVLQVRTEESFLRDMHSAAYDLYCLHTRRWI